MLKISSLHIRREKRDSRVSLSSGGSRCSGSGSAYHVFLFMLSLSARTTSTTTTYTSNEEKGVTTRLWRRGQSTVLIHFNHIIHLLLVVSLSITPATCPHLLALNGDLHMERLAVLKGVILLFFVRELLGLVQVLLILLKSNLEIQSLRSLLETDTNVSLLAILLNSHDEVTRRIQHGFDDLFVTLRQLPYSRTVVTDGRGGKKLSVVVN